MFQTQRKQSVKTEERARSKKRFLLFSFVDAQKKFLILHPPPHEKKIRKQVYWMEYHYMYVVLGVEPLIVGLDLLKKRKKGKQ